MSGQRCRHKLTLLARYLQAAVKIIGPIKMQVDIMLAS